MDFFQKKYPDKKLEINKRKIYLNFFFVCLFIPAMIYGLVDEGLKYLSNVHLNFEGYIPHLSYEPRPQKTQILKRNLRYSSNKVESLGAFLLLLFCLLFLIIGFLLVFIDSLYLIRRGYVVYLQREGLLFANGQFIQWSNIQSIDITRVRRGKFHKDVIQIVSKSGKWKELSGFELPIKDAHKVILSCWHAQRPWPKDKSIRNNFLHY